MHSNTRKICKSKFSNTDVHKKKVNINKENSDTHNDPHSVCIVCRGDVNSRCQECSERSPKLVLSACKYQ